MGKLNLSNVAKNVQATIVKHSPGILTGIGIAGMITTTILASKATPKAITLMEDEIERRNMVLARETEKNGQENFTPIGKLNAFDVIKVTWKCYIPAVVTGATSIACLIGANSVNARRNAALATAYTLSDSAMREYREKVIETIGEKKEKDVKDAIARDKIEKNPASNNEVIITEKGNTLCYDGIFGRYFKSDMDTIKRAINAINRDIVSQMYVSLNEFYNEIGLSPVDIGYDLGWNIDDGQIDIDFSSQLAQDGTPCLVIGYNVAPKHNYSKFL